MCSMHTYIHTCVCLYIDSLADVLRKINSKHIYNLKIRKEMNELDIYSKRNRNKHRKKE